MLLSHQVTTGITLLLQVGGMFDTVESNSQWTSDIVILLTRLIHCGMVDVQVSDEMIISVANFLL